MKVKVAKEKAVIEALAEAHPQCFYVLSKHRRPLKLGIKEDLRPLVSFTEEELSAALYRYVKNDGYLKACTEGSPRIALDGNAAREVTAEEAAWSAKLLVEHQQWREAKKAKRDRHRLEEAARRARKQQQAAPQPKRLTLADLKVAAARRKDAAA
jgi:ProP effector